ncbi:putative T7SS-secreted protein [Streptomyces sp. NPDC002992]|uniref:putative T7SS-secreted protein n=1 Tax=Streptomyces sp. NPDC002992 TaxID=3154273 RepID=UPI0033B576FA
MPEWGDLFEGGKRLLGETVDGATNLIGDGLDYVGAEGAADKVEDWGDRAASALGAEVGEAQLGQSEEPNELVHGDVGEITATAKNLRDFQSAFDSVGRGLKAVEGSGRWKGEAQKAFQEEFQALPTSWLHASDAFGSAAAALEAYGTTVTWAQGKAREAIALYKRGNESSTSAQAAYEKKVADYKASLDGDAPLPCPAPGTDPGDAQRARAQEILADARRQRNEAADTAKKAIASALAHAPAEPSLGDRLKNDAMDYALATGASRLHFAGGAVKGVVGLTNFIRSMDPRDAYNRAHPAEYYENVNMTLAGVVSTAAHPDRALQAAWEAAKSDPEEFLGRAVLEAAGTKGAGGLKTIARAKDLVDSPNGKGRQGHTTDPHGTCRPDGEKCKGGDPVDMATGRMILPQTDITLPGSLPLVLARTFESSYRAGRWFGPTWASTLDQRLEIDSEGVVLLCEDTSLLAYPHPAPGVPVLPTHGSRRWTLDRDGDTYTVTDPGTGRVLHFTLHTDDLALLSQIDDRNGNWITFEYDAGGAPASVVHHGGYHLRLTTDGSRVTALHLGEQEILRYGYTDGHLTSVTNSSGRPLRFGYDEHGRITSWTDTNDSRYDYVYDEEHRCVSQSGADGVMAFRYTWAEDLTTITDALGRTTRYEVDERRQIVAETDPTGAVTTYERDARGRLLSRTDPLGAVTRFSYDEEGRLVSAVRPDGRTATAEYDALGLPVRVTRTDGTTVRQTYDERGNLTSATEASGARTEFSYDAAGSLTAITDPLGHTTRLALDGHGLPTEITDPLGATTRYERDAFGRTIAITDPLGAVTRFEWTVEGRLSRRLAPDGSEESWTYDGEGNCLTHTDALGATTRFEYGHFDVVTSRTEPDGVRYAFTHDAALQLTQVTNPQGLTWDYDYDPAGRLLSETDFDDRTLTYGYDGAGRLTSRTNPLGQTVLFEHNELGQVVRKDAEGAVTTYEYDIFDELAAATGPDATLIRLRDRYGRLKSETVNGRTLTYAYDGIGRRVGRTTPAGSVSEWSYDAAGRRSRLTTSGRTLDFSFDALGREVTRDIGGFASLTSSFDELGRLTTQEITSQGNHLQHRRYGYRPDGGLISVTDALSGTRRFDLDGAGRVTAVRADRWTERYAYDEAGNQSEASWPSTHPSHESTGTRTYQGTRITRAGSVRYEHDAQGRTVLRQKTRLSRKPDTWRYAWDAEDRLTSVTTPDGTVWRYAYDPLGRRISKRSPLETIHFTWDGTTLCEQTTDELTMTWDHAGLRPLTQTERRTDSTDERFFAIVTDLIGTPTELVDESGTLAWRTRATLWGTTTWTRDATAYTPLRFPGQYFDPESGLHYNYFRYYDPESARYLSPDPLGLAPADNPVTYVHNPHTWSDPLGLGPCPPKGERDNPFEHRADAEKAAFEAAGVPYGETPLAQWQVVGDESFKFERGYIYSNDPTHWGHFRQYETDNGSRVIVEHTHDPAGTHFHAGKPKNPSDRSFVNFGWDNTRTPDPATGKHRYPESMERYLKIDKEGGDHHFFYTGP